MHRMRNNSSGSVNDNKQTLEQWLLSQYDEEMENQDYNEELRTLYEELRALSLPENAESGDTLNSEPGSENTASDVETSRFDSGSENTASDVETLTVFPTQSADDLEAAVSQRPYTPPCNWLEEINVAINVAGLFNVLLALSSTWGSASANALLKTSCPYGENGTQHNFFKDAPKLIFFSLIPISMGIGYAAQHLLRDHSEALRLWRLLRSEIIDSVETSFFWSLFIIQNKLPKGFYGFGIIVAAKLASVAYHLVNPKFMDGARQVIGNALSNPFKFYIAMAEVSFFTAMSLLAATNAIIYTFIDTFWYTEHNPAPPSSVTHFQSVALATACVLGLLLPWTNQRGVQAGWFSEAFINGIYYIFNPINSIIDCVSGGKTMSPSGFKTYGGILATFAALISIPAALILALDTTKQHYAPWEEQGGWVKPTKVWVGKKISDCYHTLFSHTSEAENEEEEQALLNPVGGGTINGDRHFYYETV